MDAVCDDSIDVVRALLDSGVDVNAKRDDGFTALLLAAFFGRTEIVGLLLERGADIHAKTRFGTSALVWATARGFPKIVNVLQKAEQRAAAPPKVLTPVTDPLPVVAEAFHPSQVFVARVTSSPKSLAVLAAVIIFVIGLGIFATYRISRTLSEEAKQTTPTVNELKVESNTSVEQPVPQKADQEQPTEAPEATLHSNHTVKPSIKTFSSPIPARSFLSRQREGAVARDAEVKHEEVEGDSKPAPLTVEVSRERRPEPPPARNDGEAPRPQPAPLGITSSKPQSKVIQWP